MSEQAYTHLMDKNIATAALLATAARTGYTVLGQNEDMVALAFQLEAQGKLTRVRVNGFETFVTPEAAGRLADR